MNRIKQWISLCICFFGGHTNPEKHLTETERAIYTKRCSRCKSTLGFPQWKIKHIPPPNSNTQQIKEWEVYCETKWQELRESCA